MRSYMLTVAQSWVLSLTPDITPFSGARVFASSADMGEELLTSEPAYNTPVLSLELNVKTVAAR